MEGITMDNDEVISTLNDLIEISKDGEEGFRTCAKDAEDARLKAYFADRAEDCKTGAQELQTLVRSLGGDPEKTSSVSGTLHRRWVEIKTALSANDDVAVLNECERGEDVALRAYRKALDKDLPTSIRPIIEKQLMGVQHNHDQVKQLRDAARAHS
jgi:uncharacterized protein (TIGR02284 family)